LRGDKKKYKVNTRKRDLEGDFEAGMGKEVEIGRVLVEKWL
jgi:hypothetical protein